MSEHRRVSIYVIVILIRTGMMTQLNMWSIILKKLIKYTSKFCRRTVTVE